MEKLQPVIKHIFWILFGLAAMLILTGWWMAKGALSTQIETRRTAVDKAFADAQVNVAAVPNARWTEGATAKNDNHSKAFAESALGLWKEQQDARTYPAAIRDEISKVKYGATIEKKTLREQYARLYRKYFLEQLKIIKPFLEGEGLVDVSNAKITQEDENRWITKRPTSPEIWNAQEDIWLLGSIYESIAAVNEGYDRIDKAALRSLLKLELRGGDRDAPVGGGGGGGGFGMGGMGAGYEGAGAMGMDMPGMEGSGGMSSMGGGGGASQPWKQFEGTLAGDLLTEEFGPVGGGAVGMGTDMMMGGLDEGSGDGGFGGGAPVEEKRYVDEDETLPYRTRAFQLEVKILQQEIPALLAALTNSRFPVEIVRVDASFGMPMGAGGGMGGMNYGMDSMGGMGGGGAYEGGSGGAMGMTEEAPNMGMGMGMGGMGGGGGGGGKMAGIYGTGGAGGGGGMAAPGGLNGMNGMGGGTGGIGGMGFGGQAMGMGMGTGMGAGGGVRGTKSKDRIAAKKNAIGSRLLAAAMDDENLSTVRIAGLMTMYRSPQENESEAAAETAATVESQEAGGVQLPPVEPIPGVTEPNATEPGTTEPGTTEPRATTPEATDPAAVPDTTTPATTPSESVSPGGGDPAGTVPGSVPEEGATPADPAAPATLEGQPAAAVSGDGGT